MSQTSVGSGTPNDRNENPAPSDGYPSKTFGAESSPPQQPPLSAPPSPEPSSQDPSQEPCESDAAEMASSLDTDKATAWLPDGPNVAPSAWELDAARGHPDPQDPAPDAAAEL